MANIKILTELESDLLAELFNIGVGRAADALSQEADDAAQGQGCLPPGSTYPNQKHPSPRPVAPGGFPHQFPGGCSAMRSRF